MEQKEKVVPVRSMMAKIGSSSTASFIVNLDTRWRWVFNSTRRSLYLRERTPAPIEQESGWDPKLALTV